MERGQITRILKVGIIATLIILAFEVVFSIPGVIEWFSDIIQNSGGWFFVVLWLIMFLQVTILNIPAYVVLNASVVVGVKTLSFEFILTVLSAYMVGCVVAYWLGRIFGVKATKWCAGSEKDFNKWCKVLNERKSKIFYLITVLLPVFPDDLLCIVAGSVKLNFWFYVIANLIGRSIGLITMLLALQVVIFASGGFNWMLVVWSICLIVETTLYIIMVKKVGKDE